MPPLEALIDACIAHPQGLFLGPEDARDVCAELQRLRVEVSEARFEFLLIGVTAGAVLVGSFAILVTRGIL